jgi:hypothetical protein
VRGARDGRVACELYGQALGTANPRDDVSRPTREPTAPSRATDTIRAICKRARAGTRGRLM